ncbi:hypothetical protein FIA58_011210 [Flavobacterium jejuense]|uniref:Protein TolB n=1 Tax=Flavobacterium jejuense TaxID=1544455 RepID=A0ABX0IVZ6_9FLAO|nr:PD40 domain-containing protein [Flavobacterium jejuense]NHN26246.1 hypothetical protein [Flavobacterium jejuense]
MNKSLIFIIFCNFSILVAQKENIEPAFDFLAQYSNCRDLAISKNQDEVYFTLQSSNEEVSRILYTKKVKNKWTKPQLAIFSSNHRDIEPFLSHDDLRLYFASNRPLSDTVTKSKDYDIWYVERKTITENWSKPINLGMPINTDKDEFYPSVALNGNIYYTSENENSFGKDDIFVSHWKNDKYTKPENLGTAINSNGYEFNAFIAPDESFLMFTAYNRKDGLGSGDLYISYKSKDGNWEIAKNLGNQINSTAMDYCPFYDTNTGILYFTSRRNLVTNKPFKTTDEFEKEINQYKNGFSRIYKTNLKL